MQQWFTAQCLERRAAPLGASGCSFSSTLLQIWGSWKVFVACIMVLSLHWNFLKRCIYALIQDLTSSSFIINPSTGLLHLSPLSYRKYWGSLLIHLLMVCVSARWKVDMCMAEKFFSVCFVLYYEYFHFRLTEFVKCRNKFFLFYLLIQNSACSFSFVLSCSFILLFIFLCVVWNMH